LEKKKANSREDSMKYWTRLAGVFAALAIAGAANAQNYPSREIKMIVPFPAGGPSDIVARIAADGMSKHLGHNVLIENVAGAGGTVARRVLRKLHRTATRFLPLAWAPLSRRRRSIPI